MDSDTFTTFEAAGWNRTAARLRQADRPDHRPGAVAMVTDPPRIRAEFDRLAEPYRCRIPVSVVIATATR